MAGMADTVVKSMSVPSLTAAIAMDSSPREQGRAAHDTFLHSKDEKSTLLQSSMSHFTDTFSGSSSSMAQISITTLQWTGKPKGS
ncbi:MAG: hypothetical protein AB2L14_19480 [Candidatus Xenobiia bacterium LiM19]